MRLTIKVCCVGPATGMAEENGSDIELAGSGQHPTDYVNSVYTLDATLVPKLWSIRNEVVFVHARGTERGPKMFSKSSIERR